MKIISWNLKNIGQSKLTNKLSPVLAAAGLGGTVLEYITKLVMADNAWRNITTANPADILLIKPEAFDPDQKWHLKQNAVVGTSSARRKVQLLHHRPDVQIEDI